MLDNKTGITNLANFTLIQLTKSNKASILLLKSRENSLNYTIKAFTKDEQSQYIYHREHRIHSSLSHPHVIQYIANPSLKYNSSQLNTILMEYAPYGDFFSLITDFCLVDEKLIRTYFHHLIDGLAYMHSQGIAHLDLKLENVLLTDDFVLKICDFDLTQDFADPQLISKGTKNYRAPELWLNSNHYTPKKVDYFAADVFSAGVCLYALVTGAFPFSEEVDGQGGG